MTETKTLSKYNALLKINDILNCTLQAFTLQFDELLDRVLHTLNSAMQAEASSILLLDTAEQSLYFRSATGERSTEVKNLKIQMGKGIAGWVAQAKTPLLVPDVSKDPRWDPTISELVSFPTKSIICVPLEYNGQSLGVMEVLNSLSKDSFNDEDLEFLQAISEPVSVAIRNSRLYSKVNKENDALRNLLGLKQKIIGNSGKLEEVLKLAMRVSKTDVAVLLQGETGTGKELIARTIHENSDRKNAPFVEINCAAIPDSLIEEELFGHEKGSFTDAHQSKKGKFELADGGTLFLDEIGDMSMSAQSKVLRALQDRKIVKIGSNTPVEVNVRIISATHKDLKDDITKKTFREDLYYRLNEFSLCLPPLRERLDDLPILTNNFIESFNVDLRKNIKGISNNALKHMMEYQWPGNIRELKNFIRRTMILIDNDIIQEGDVHLFSEQKEQVWDSEPIRLRDMERKHIYKILTLAKLNKSKAANLLEISRPTLDKKIKEYQLDSLLEIQKQQTN